MCHRGGCRAEITIRSGLGGRSQEISLAAFSNLAPEIVAVSRAGEGPCMYDLRGCFHSALSPPRLRWQTPGNFAHGHGMARASITRLVCRRGGGIGVISIMSSSLSLRCSGFGVRAVFWVGGPVLRPVLCLRPSCMHGLLFNWHCWTTRLVHTLNQRKTSDRRRSSISISTSHPFLPAPEIHTEYLYGRECLHLGCQEK